MVEVKPQPTVYTVLLIIAIVALVVAIGVVLWKLTSETPVGYGMKIEQLLKPWQPPAP